MLAFLYALLLSALTLAAIAGVLFFWFKLLKWTFIGLSKAGKWLINIGKRLFRPLSTGLLFLGAFLGGLFLGFMPWSAILLIVLIALL